MDGRIAVWATAAGAIASVEGSSAKKRDLLFNTAMVLRVHQDGVAKTESQYQTTPFLNDIIRPTSYGIIPNCWSCTAARHWLFIWDTLLDTFHMLFVAAMIGTLLPAVNSSLHQSSQCHTRRLSELCEEESTRFQH
jgi:hypothetical protein